MKTRVFLAPKEWTKLVDYSNWIRSCTDGYACPVPVVIIMNPMFDVEFSEDRRGPNRDRRVS